MTQFFIAVLLIIYVTNPTVADWKENAEAIDISGGENHTIVLTKDKTVWTCGPDSDDPDNTYYGVLGTGSTYYGLFEKSLIEVLGGDMGTLCLQDINDIDAGWKHSLALDVYDMVWAWGDNFEGQLGIDSQDSKTSPAQVLRGEQPDDPCQPSGYLKHIIGISAGRSGEHSLAVDDPKELVRTMTLTTMSRGQGHI